MTAWEIFLRRCRKWILWRRGNGSGKRGASALTDPTTNKSRAPRKVGYQELKMNWHPWYMPPSLWGSQSNQTNLLWLHLTMARWWRSRLHSWVRPLILEGSCIRKALSWRHLQLKTIHLWGTREILMALISKCKTVRMGVTAQSIRTKSNKPRKTSMRNSKDEKPDKTFSIKIRTKVPFHPRSSLLCTGTNTNHFSIISTTNDWMPKMSINIKLAKWKKTSTESTNKTLILNNIICQDRKLTTSMPRIPWRRREKFHLIWARRLLRMKPRAIKIGLWGSGISPCPTNGMAAVHIHLLMLPRTQATSHTFPSCPMAQTSTGPRERQLRSHNYQIRWEAEVTRVTRRESPLVAPRPRDQEQSWRGSTTSSMRPMLTIGARKRAVRGHEAGLWVIMHRDRRSKRCRTAR